MKIKNCCPHVVPALIHSESPSGHILFIICPECMGTVKADQIKYKLIGQCSKVLHEQWNQMLEDRKQATLKEISKIVDTQS